MSNENIYDVKIPKSLFIKNNEKEGIEDITIAMNKIRIANGKKALPATHYIHRIIEEGIKAERKRLNIEDLE